MMPLEGKALVLLRSRRAVVSVPRFCRRSMLLIVGAAAAGPLWEPPASGEAAGRSEKTLRTATVSGQSAGASMAIQHLVAYSKITLGAALAAGSPYGCGAFSEGHMPTGACYYGGSDVGKLKRYTIGHFLKGLIDSPWNLKNTPVLLFNGQNDWIVYPECMEDTAKELEGFVLPERIITKFHTDASHVWSLDHGDCGCGACATKGEGLCCDYNNCHYDLSGDFLSHVYGNLSQRAPVRPELFWIQQYKYIPPKQSWWTNARMKDWALAYVPRSCEQAPDECRVHIHYHGCIDNIWAERLAWVLHLDVNEYAEANGLIILYPQAAGDSVTGEGCWNWGYPEDDQLFDTKWSVQLQTIIAMLQDLPAAVAAAVKLPVPQGPPAEPSDEGESSILV